MMFRDAFMSKVFAVMKELKVGKYVMIDEEPCRIVGIQTSAPGKHGAAKMRVDAIGLFDGSKRNLLKPSDADCEIPIIERKNGQVVSISGDTAQLMDLVSFETFDARIPEELKDKIADGKEVEYMETMGRRLLQRIRE